MIERHPLVQRGLRGYVAHSSRLIDAHTECGGRWWAWCPQSLTLCVSCGGARRLDEPVRRPVDPCCRVVPPQTSRSLDRTEQWGVHLHARATYWSPGWPRRDSHPWQHARDSSGSLSPIEYHTYSNGCRGSDQWSQRAVRRRSEIG